MVFISIAMTFYIYTNNLKLLVGIIMSDKNLSKGVRPAFEDGACLV